MEQSYNNPSSKSSSMSRRPKAYNLPLLYLVPIIILALVTSFFTLWYLSLFSHTFTFATKTATSPSPSIRFMSPDLLKINPANVKIIVHPKNISLGTEDHNSHVPPTGPLNSGSSSDHARGSSSPKNNINQDVFHNREIFLQSYEEMKKTLKIYIYPHNKTDPYANCLLPRDGKIEPGGNYASEAYFKIALSNSHFLTTDTSKADFFFLPFSIATLRHDPRVGVGGLADFVHDYMKSVTRDYPYWNRTGGADHFFASCHSISTLATTKVQQVKANAIQVVCSSTYFRTNYYAHKDVSLPQIWPRHDAPQDLSDVSKRKKLAFFAGTVISPIRKFLVKTWKNDTSIFAHDGRLNTPYADQLLGSKYCLHAKGFEVNTARVGDALYYGCVPVIIADYYDLPFMDVLNWRAFSVIVLGSDIPNLKKILERISHEEYLVLQANVLKVRRHFQWNISPLDFDVFYMVMYELWLRRSSIRVLS